MKTKGQIEAEVCEAIIRFEKDYMGRGPEETKAWIIDDMVLVRLRGVLTPAEKKLASIGDGNHGRSLIKQVRLELIEGARPLLDAIIGEATGCVVKGMHTDISTLSGERVILFVLSGMPTFAPSPP